MTVSPTAPLRSATYVGNGVETEFAFPFFVVNPEEVSVYLDNVVQPTGFTVSPMPPGGSFGGYVNFIAPPAMGVRIDILDRPIISQERDYTNQAGVYPDDVERALDKITRIVRRLNYDLTRAVKLPVGAVQERPLIPGVPNSALIWSADGSRIVSGPLLADLDAVRAAADAVLQAKADIETLLGVPIPIDYETTYRNAVVTGGSGSTPGAGDGDPDNLLNIYLEARD